jgi:hypothetical protein
LHKEVFYRLSRRRLRERPLRCGNEHHRGVQNAISKAITGVNALVTRESIGLILIDFISLS